MKMWLDNFKKRNYFGIKQQECWCKKEDCGTSFTVFSETCL